MKKIIYQSGNINDPKKALIMIHGRGGSAQDIMAIAEYLNVEDFLLIAPEAEQNSWYPNSFIAPVSSNQPKLDQALDHINQSIQVAQDKGIIAENIYILGFSQGACLALEYSCRNAEKYGGDSAFQHKQHNFMDTPVFIGTSDPDFHVPVERVKDSAKIMQELGARVEMRIYPNMGHTITQDEIKIVNQVIFN